MLILNWYRCHKSHDRTHLKGVNKFIFNKQYLHTHSHTFFFIFSLNYTQHMLHHGRFVDTWSLHLEDDFTWSINVANIYIYNVVCWIIVFHVYISFTKLNNVYILILIFIWKTLYYLERIVCYNRRMTCTIDTECVFTGSACFAIWFSSFMYR